MENKVRLYNPKTINIEFEDISLKVKQNKDFKQIIKGVSGKFLSGELTAIMGPSGAGKTSLLNILTGFQISGVTGVIKCNNNSKRKKGPQQYKNDSCYILQDDNLPPWFTVQEMMIMATNLKIADLSEKLKFFLIEEILINLGLLNARNTRCQNLSGGQKKRLSVALELVDNPPIMFLDEPTTGLDSASTTQCIEMLKNLARGGRTIICTIHQPSSLIYAMFDHVYVMAKGKCVYQGASTNTVSYLSSLGFYCPQFHSPADYLLEVANGDYGEYTDYLAKAASDNKWREAIPISYKSNNDADIGRNMEVYINERQLSHRIPSEWTQFWILSKRYGLQLHRDWTVSKLKLVLHFLVGIFLGVFYQNCGYDASRVINNLGFCLCGLVYLAYTSLMPAVLKFPSELAVLKKERFNRWYKLRTYYMAFMIFDIPMQAVFSAVYCSTSYFISGQPVESSRFLMFLLIQTLVALSSSGFGLFLGTVVNPVNGTFFGAISMALMISLGGFLIIFTHMSKLFYLISYLSYMSYGIEGLIQALYGFNRPHLICPDDVEYCHYISPALLLQDIGMSKPNYWFDVAYLLVTFIMFRVITYYVLRRKLSSA